MSSGQFSIYDAVAVPVLVFQPDRDGSLSCAFANPAARAALGFRLSDMLGRRADELVPGPSGAAFQAAQMAVQAGSDGMVLSVEFTRRDAPQTMQVMLRPGADAPGSVVATCLLASDQCAARDMARSLETATSDMETFVAMAAHDLRSPLRHINFLLEELREDFHDFGDGKVDVINALHEVTTMTSGLISEVLNHAQTASLPETNARIDLNNIVARVLGALDPDGRHNVSVTNCSLQGDRVALQVLVQNILDNAFKHCGRDRVNLAISVCQAPGGLINLTFDDNGRGFRNPGNAFLAGGPFRSDSGFGLFGLQRLVHKRGGTIEVTNRPDETGGRVIVSLPGEMLDAPPRPIPAAGTGGVLLQPHTPGSV